MNCYKTTIPRAAVGVAAVAMTAITIGLLIVLPAKMKPDTQELHTLTAASAVTTTPTAVVASQSRIRCSDNRTWRVRADPGSRSPAGREVAYIC